VSQAGRLHEVGDADAVDATLSEQPSRYIENSFAVFCCLRAAYLHPVEPISSPVSLYDERHDSS
jgi:hypothetical protein